jgi:hypothetical protein
MKNKERRTKERKRSLHTTAAGLVSRVGDGGGELASDLVADWGVVAPSRVLPSSR